jgi:hypothetical protein
VYIASPTTTIANLPPTSTPTTPPSANRPVIAQSKVPSWRVPEQAAERVQADGHQRGSDSELHAQTQHHHQRGHDEKSAAHAEEPGQEADAEAHQPQARHVPAGSARKTSQL